MSHPSRFEADDPYLARLREVCLALPEAAVPSGEGLEVRPGSQLHLMLMNFDPAKAVGGRVTLDLLFRDAGQVSADFALASDSRAGWTAFGRE